MDLKNLDAKKVLLIGGALFLGGWALKKMSGNRDQSASDQDKDLTPAQSGGVKSGAGSVKVDVPGTTTPTVSDVDLKLKKGSKNGTVTKVQFIINQIQSMRGQRTAIDPGTGKKVEFPISADGSFGNQTASGARVAFGNEFTRNGYITLRKAREQLARTAGYYKKPFPSNLVGVSNESDLHKIYNANIANAAGTSGSSSGSSDVNTFDVIYNAGAAASTGLFYP